MHIFFFSPNVNLGRAMARELGSGFEFRQSELLQLPADLEQVQAWWDVVLVDLSAANTECEAEAGLALVQRITRLQTPAPVVALLARDDRRLVLKAIERGVFDTIAVPRTFSSCGWCCGGPGAITRPNASSNVCAWTGCIRGGCAI